MLTGIDLNDTFTKNCSFTDTTITIFNLNEIPVNEPIKIVIKGIGNPTTDIN